MAIDSFRDLIVWQKSMDLVVAVYRLSQSFPNEERFGLTNQLRRASTSVPANIAEGHGRLSQPDYVRFLSIARGSLLEVETFLELAERLQFADQAHIDATLNIAQEVGRLLNGLIRSLRNSGMRESSAIYNADNDADSTLNDINYDGNGDDVSGL